MPWKGEQDPYKVWLSEIILQQTRVEQGWDYYNRFISAFPTIQHLAKATDTKIFKLWEGLGYYTRCKNLISTARFISKELNGKFPENYAGILALKGVGPYTAAAIASFAFNLPHAVVDGNVYRVLARYFGNDLPIDSSAGKFLFSVLANELLEKKLPGIFNQALMDFGAVVCKPKLPLCDICPLKDGCTAKLKGLVGQLPVKSKSINKKTRWFYYLIIENNNKVYVRKRGKKDIWENLYEFILIETPKAVSFKKLKTMDGYKNLIPDTGSQKTVVSEHYCQQLTHQTIWAQFIIIKFSRSLTLPGYKPVSKRGLFRLPFPRLISRFLEKTTVDLLAK